MKRWWGILTVLATILAGCDNMGDQPKKEAFESSEFFADGTSARHPPAFTISRAEGAADGALMTGVRNGRLVERNPLPIEAKDLQRGQSLFNAHCSVCHGKSGYGDGMVVQRGFPEPPSYHSDRLRAAPDGYLFRVITDGYGVMYPYGGRIESKDRWRIIAYLRTLQLSQHATADQISAETWQELEQEANGG